MTKIFESIEVYECISCGKKEDENSALDGHLEMKEILNGVYGKNKFKCSNCCNDEQLSFENEQFKKVNYSNQKTGITVLLCQLLESGLSKNDIAIYSNLWILKKGGENIIFDINQAELSKDLGIQKPNISRSIKKLTDTGILEKISSKQYRFTIFKDLHDEDEFK
ncbi:MAG: putative transcriptional regulator [Psychroserpens sp.]|jgi:predicted transcriptional regulator